MSEIFNLNRFGKYFVYDLKQMWRHNGKAAILIGFFSVILYMAWVMGSLVFAHEWHGPMIEARAVVFFLAVLALGLYQTRTYGYLTEKKAGSAWLLVPASPAEKFASMLVMTLVVLPLAFLTAYFFTDWLIALVDPTVGDALIGGASHLIREFNEVLNAAGEEGYNLTLSSLLLPSILSLFNNLLYFLLCGLVFKKWKIAGAFAILFGCQFLLINTAGLMIRGMDMELLVHAGAAQQALDHSLRWGTGLCIVTIVALMALIFLRIKTLKH